MMLNEMDEVDKIILTKFLTVCPEQMAYDWLEKKSRGRKKYWGPYPEKYTDIQEYTILNRDSEFLRFGLARYGYSTMIAKALYDIGDKAMRLTIRANHPTGPWFELLPPAVTGESFIEELVAVTKNPFLHDQWFEDLFERKGIFSKITDQSYGVLLLNVGSHIRLQTPCDPEILDGYAEHSYEKIFSLAWKLTLTLPAEMQWVGPLYKLLDKCILPTSDYDAKAALDRWHIELEENKLISYSWWLRSRIADCLKPTSEMLKSSDLAVRTSFYRRFSIRHFPNWPTFVENDGEEFLRAALNNPEFWRTSEFRDVLNRLCWDAPDPNHSMMLPNEWNWTKERFGKLYPEWFNDKNDEIG